MEALIFIADGFEDSEFYYPYYRLKEEGIGVIVAGPQAGEFTGKHGYTFEADTALDEVSAESCDILVIPGGKAPETIRLNKNAVKLTMEIMQAGKPLAAICHGGQVLISADVLKGKKATCWKSISDDLKAAGAEYIDQEVVVDGNLVTSRCPADLPMFMKELLKLCAQSTA
jgi:protease I